MGQNTGNVRRSGYTILELMIAIGGISSSLASTRQPYGGLATGSPLGSPWDPTTGWHTPLDVTPLPMRGPDEAFATHRRARSLLAAALDRLMFSVPRQAEFPLPPA
jgi:hypothetical protein